MSVGTMQNTASESAYDPFAYVADSGGGGDFETCPAGSYPGTLVGLIDLGTHDEEYQGAMKKSHQAALIFEVDEVQKNGKPFLFAKQINLPKKGKLNDKAALRKILEGWLGRKIADGEGGNIRKQLGKAGIINITHSGNGEKVYANFGGIGPLMKGMAAPTPQTAIFTYQVEPGVFDGIPKDEWLPRIYGRKIADVIAECDELKVRTGTSAPSKEEDDDIPF